MAHNQVDISLSDAAVMDKHYTSICRYTIYYSLCRRFMVEKVALEAHLLIPLGKRTSAGEELLLG